MERYVYAALISEVVRGEIAVSDRIGLTKILRDCRERMVVRMVRMEGEIPDLVVEVQQSRPFSLLGKLDKAALEVSIVRLLS